MFQGCFEDVPSCQLAGYRRSRIAATGPLIPWRWSNDVSRHSQTFTQPYCWWKKSCTTLDGWNPINNGINHLSTGVGFLPSTVGTSWNITPSDAWGTNRLCKALLLAVDFRNIKPGVGKKKAVRSQSPALSLSRAGTSRLAQSDKAWSRGESWISAEKADTLRLSVLSESTWPKFNNV